MVAQNDPVRVRVKGTIQKLLRHTASARLKRDELNILDFGCFLGGRAALLAETIIQEHNPKKLRVYGIDMETTPLSVARQMGATDLQFELVPLLLAGEVGARKLKAMVPQFDLITVFNPGLSDRLTNIIRCIVLAALSGSPYAYNSIRAYALDLLKRDLGINTAAMHDLTPRDLMSALRNSYLEKPLLEAFPLLLAENGLI